jgi:hypothetical protein
MLSSKVAGKIFDAEIMYFFREHVLVFHCPYDNLFTAESQRAQSEFSFSFAAETPENERQHAFGNLSVF